MGEGKNVFFPLLLLFVIIYTDITKAQLVSPCPRLFSYDRHKETGKWYGVVTLISESELSGVWLRLIFDRPSLQLGNWFGEVVTMDNKEFLVKNPKHRVSANMPYALRFYVKYDPAQPPPQLIAIRLNAKTVCPEQEVTTQAPIVGGAELQTVAASAVQTPPPPPPPQATPSPDVGSADSNSSPVGGVFAKPGGGWFPPASTDDDVFLGDFQLLNRPQHNEQPIDDVECGTVITPTPLRKKRQTNENPQSVQPARSLYYDGQRITEEGFSNLLRQFLDVIRSAPPEQGFSPLTYNVPQFSELQQPKPLITHGEATNEGEFPWHVALYHERGADLQYICGASLISKLYVITVAHCVTRKSNKKPLNPDSIIVYMGKYYLKRWSNPGIQDSQVAKIIPHPDYDSASFSDDLALIKLLNPIKFTNFVRPVCLWEGARPLSAVIDKPGTVVGWGFDHTGKVTEKLMQAKMPVVSKEVCIYSFPDFFSRFTSEKTYCAGFRNGTSVCNGDSGGGMVFPKPTSTNQRKVWQLRGLVSISVALQNNFRCDATHYVVFTDVAKYLDWIKLEMTKD